MDGRERGVAAEIVIGRTTTAAGSSHFPEIKAIRIICQRNNFCLSFSQQKNERIGPHQKKKKNYHFPSSHHLSSSKHLNNWIYLIKNFNYFFKKFHSNNYKLEPIVATRQDQCSSLSSWTAGSSKSHGSVCNDPPLLYLHAASSRLLLPATSWTAVPKAPEKKEENNRRQADVFFCVCVSAAGAHKCDVLIRPIGTFQFHLSFVTVKVINFPRPANVLPFFFSAKNSRGYIKWKSILSRNVTWCPVSATSNKL